MEHWRDWVPWILTVLIPALFQMWRELRRKDRALETVIKGIDALKQSNMPAHEEAKASIQRAAGGEKSKLNLALKKEVQNKTTRFEKI